MRYCFSYYSYFHVQSVAIMRLVCASIFLLLLNIFFTTTVFGEKSEIGMKYFRAETKDNCNVYMNYSVLKPSFSLKALHPDRLTQADKIFVSKFNAMFAETFLREGTPCTYEGDGKQFNYFQKLAIYNRCAAYEKRIGYNENDWSASHLPLPTNCISKRLWSAGVVDVVQGDPATPSITIEQWMAEAKANK